MKAQAFSAVIAYISLDQAMPFSTAAAASAKRRVEATAAIAPSQKTQRGLPKASEITVTAVEKNKNGKNAQ